MVADCSSVLGLMPFNIGQYGVVLASTEHSLGIVGCTVVIVREDLIVANKQIPSMFSFEVMLRTSSIFNTPNCFSVYVLGKYVKYLLDTYQSPQQVHKKMVETHKSIS